MKSFLDQAVDRLAAELREDPSGAKSLAHIIAVVPTAQSGRRLRAALARRFGALVPPKVVLPDQLLLDYDDPRLASRADELIAFREALGEKAASYDLPAQLSDLRHALAERQLTFATVAEHLRTHPESAAAAELPRWEQLAEIERGYLAALAKRGRCDRIELMKERATEPRCGEEVLRFDDFYASADTTFSVPVANIHACGTAANEAWRIAEYFAAVKPNEALPALCVVDPEMFPELQGAFEAKGLKLHNPSSVRLATSSLGHLVGTIASLIRTGSYQVFSSFIRMGDVRRWIMEELQLTDEELTAAFVDLDNRQAELLPEKIDDIAPRTEKRLRAIFEFVKVQLRKNGVRGMLHAIFRNHLLDEREESSREFAAAAECVNGILDYADDLELFERLLDEATYNLEPDEGDVVLSDGWLELPFLDTKELVIAGFREGCVPESVVGHPYLPDSLRHELGLTDNAVRTQRDRAILSLALSGRPADAVHVCFHAVDAQGDVLKPSRLLFETADDADLCERVRRFYGTHAGTEVGHASDLPRAWKLKLPIPLVHEQLTKLSPTRLDSYLRCPFTYFLNRKDVLGDKRMDDRAEELASWEYGNLAHEALEKWARSDLKDSSDPEAIRNFLSEDVDRQLVARFGTSIPAIVAMQGESVRRRLSIFADRQVEWRAAGWKIVAVEERLEIQIGHTRFSGKCDRIDRNEQTGKWCVIDYKTWDKADKAESRTVKRDGTVEWKSLQLPLYCAMLDVNPDPRFVEAKRENITSCYCVLGKTEENVLFTTPASGDLVVDAEKYALEQIALIERGIFWPPSPKGEWRYDFEDWLFPSPEQSVDEDWIADQLKRKEELTNGS